ncbi:MAG TPA: cytochrome c oxidase assembly protein [Caulobacteraceae bacterium]|nr:cytochrome c oxidase assembly protein [Caulobacteraceae bacterium]
MTELIASGQARRPRPSFNPGLRGALSGALILLAGAGPAFADESDVLTNQTAWSAWDFTPDVVIMTGLVLAIYINGMVRRWHAASRVPLWRHVLFFAGVACVFVALQSPIDSIADRLFLVHQIQHLLLRMVGPMLLALSWPESMLTAGLPRVVRRNVLAPVASSRVVQELFGILGHPAIATILFVAALYVWQIPRLHDFAVLHEGVHYTMHVTMLIAGLLFWWVIFDRRPPKSMLDLDDHHLPWWRLSGRRSPYGLRYGVRAMMLALVILSNILLGAVTVLKRVELYPVYDLHGRLFGYTPMADEQLGGFIIWVPSSMMCILAVLIVLRLLALFESGVRRRAWAQPGSNAIALLYPTTGAELIRLAQPKNRSMALGLSAFVISIFATVMLLGVLVQASDTGGLRWLEPAGGVANLAHSPELETKYGGQDG